MPLQRKWFRVENGKIIYLDKASFEARRVQNFVGIKMNLPEGGGVKRKSDDDISIPCSSSKSESGSGGTNSTKIEKEEVDTSSSGTSTSGGVADGGGSSEKKRKWTYGQTMSPEEKVEQEMSHSDEMIKNYQKFVLSTLRVILEEWEEYRHQTCFLTNIAQLGRLERDLLRRLNIVRSLEVGENEEYVRRKTWTTARYREEIANVRALKESEEETLEKLRPSLRGKNGTRACCPVCDN